MNRTVIITGASRGLGLSLACKFLEDKDRVFGISRTTRYWEEAARNLPHLERMFFHKADLAREAEVRKVIHSIRRKAPKIDVVINCAGYEGPLTRVEQLPLKEFEKIMAGNLTCTFLVCKTVIPLLKKQGQGLILNISSMAGQRAVPRLAAYSASKFGVIALSQAIAKENPEGDVRCVTVCPGGMNTKMRENLFGKEDAQKQQSPDFVANIIFQIVQNQIPLLSGSDIVIRHGKITGIHPLPSA